MSNKMHGIEIIPYEANNTIGPKTEACLVFVGVGLFSLLYYLRIPFGAFLGMLILTITGVFWGYSIRYNNQLTLRDFRLVSHNRFRYAALGLLTGTAGWGFRQVVTRLQSGYWMSTNYKASLALVGSIVMVVIAEEVFFRGYLLTRMRSFTNKAWLQIFLVCFSWGVYKVCIHVWEDQPINYYSWLLFTETYLTVPMTWWAYRTGSIATCLVGHFVWDLLVYGTQSSIPHWVF